MLFFEQNKRLNLLPTNCLFPPPLFIRWCPQTHQYSRVLAVCATTPPLQSHWPQWLEEPTNILSVASCAAAAAAFRFEISFLDGRMLYRRLLRRPPSPQGGKGDLPTPPARTTTRRCGWTCRTRTMWTTVGAQLPSACGLQVLGRFLEPWSCLLREKSHRRRWTYWPAPAPPLHGNLTPACILPQSSARPLHAISLCLKIFRSCSSHI